MTVDDVARSIGLMVMSFGGIGVTCIVLLWALDKASLLKFAIKGIKIAYRERNKK